MDVVVDGIAPVNVVNVVVVDDDADDDDGDKDECGNDGNK